MITTTGMGVRFKELDHVFLGKSSVWTLENE